MNNYNELYFWKGGKTQAPACSVSDKGPGLQLKLLLMSQSNSLNTCSLHNPSQVHFQNMFHFHGWPQQSPLHIDLLWRKRLLSIWRGLTRRHGCPGRQVLGTWYVFKDNIEKYYCNTILNQTVLIPIQNQTHSGKEITEWKFQLTVYHEKIFCHLR